MLTELGHGLDARNLETTATLLPNDGFELHTPSPNAAKQATLDSRFIYPDTNEAILDACLPILHATASRPLQW